MRGRSSITLLLVLGAFALLAAATRLETGHGVALGVEAARFGEDLVGGVLAAQSGLLRVGPDAGGPAAELGEALDPGERDAIRRHDFLVLDGREAVRWAQAGRYTRGRLLIVVNPPEVFDGVSPAGRGRLISAITRAAVKLDATLMVDCTDADLARLTPEGLRSLAEARGRVWRMVIFDGAHHLAGVGLAPEILLLPVLTVGGVAYVNHGYVRDAVPLPELARLVTEVGGGTVLLTLPRLSTPVKSPRPLGVLAREALRLLAGASRAEVVEAQRLGGTGQLGHAPRETGPATDRVEVQNGLVRLTSRIALVTTSVSPRTGEAELRRTRALIASVHAKTPISKLRLGVGYGRVSPLTIGRVDDLRKAARQAASVGKGLKAPSGTVEDIPVRVIGLPFSFWDLAVLLTLEPVARLMPAP